MDRVWAEAASLIASNPDAILATGGRVIPVLVQLSRSIPIVIPGASDPLGVGWATSLARPGRNITGFTSFEVSIYGKTLALLKQIAPAITHVAFIYNPDNPNTVIYKRTVEDAAGPLAVETIAVPIHGFADIDRAVAALADRQNSGVLFPGDLTTIALRDEIVALIARQRLPAIYSDPAFMRAGGLAFYGPDRIDLYRRSAGYVDRILRGEKAGDLWRYVLERLQPFSRERQSHDHGSGVIFRRENDVGRRFAMRPRSNAPSTTLHVSQTAA